MKARLAAMLLVVGLALGTSSCGSSLPPFVQAALVFETGAEIAISTAQGIWPGVVALLPVAQQASANVVFQDSIMGANSALAVLNDAITVDEQANNPAPNLATLSQAVSDALDQILKVISQFEGNNVPAGHEKLVAQIAFAKKQLKRVHR